MIKPKNEQLEKIFKSFVWNELVSKTSEEYLRKLLVGNTIVECRKLLLGNTTEVRQKAISGEYNSRV